MKDAENSVHIPAHNKIDPHNNNWKCNNATKTAEIWWNVWCGSSLDSSSSSTGMQTYRLGLLALCKTCDKRPTNGIPKGRQETIPAMAHQLSKSTKMLLKSGESLPPQKKSVAISGVHKHCETDKCLLQDFCANCISLTILGTGEGDVVICPKLGVHCLLDALWKPPSKCREHP